MNRADLQKLSNARVREARLLYEAGEFSGAYYLAGYAIECALKACFAKGVKRYDFPDKDGAGKVFTHKFRDLVKLAKLNDALATAERRSSAFSAGWEVVCRWSEESRYSVFTKDDADAILDAITKRKDGVLPWIKRHW